MDRATAAGNQVPVDASETLRPDPYVTGIYGASCFIYCVYTVYTLGRLVPGSSRRERKRGEEERGGGRERSKQRSLIRNRRGLRYCRALKVLRISDYR